MPAKRSARGGTQAAIGPVSVAGDKLDPEQHVNFEPINPKKRGSASATRYDAYKRARTVGEALAAGALHGDIKHDLSKGYMTLVGSASAATPQAEPPPPKRQPPIGTLAAAAGVGSQARPLLSRPSLQAASSPSQALAALAPAGGAMSVTSAPSRAAPAAVSSATASPRMAPTAPSASTSTRSSVPWQEPRALAPWQELNVSTSICHRESLVKRIESRGCLGAGSRNAPIAPVSTASFGGVGPLGTSSSSTSPAPANSQCASNTRPVPANAPVGTYARTAVAESSLEDSTASCVSLQGQACGAQASASGSVIANLNDALGMEERRFGARQSALGVESPQRCRQPMDGVRPAVTETRDAVNFRETRPDRDALSGVRDAAGFEELRRNHEAAASGNVIANLSGAVSVEERRYRARQDGFGVESPRRCLERVNGTLHAVSDAREMLRFGDPRRDHEHVSVTGDAASVGVSRRDDDALSGIRDAAGMEEPRQHHGALGDTRALPNAEANDSGCVLANLLDAVSVEESRYRARQDALSPEKPRPCLEAMDRTRHADSDSRELVRTGDPRRDPDPVSGTRGAANVEGPRRHHEAMSDTGASPSAEERRQEDLLRYQRFHALTQLLQPDGIVVPEPAQPEQRTVTSSERSGIDNVERHADAGTSTPTVPEEEDEEGDGIILPTAEAEQSAPGSASSMASDLSDTELLAACARVEAQVEARNVPQPPDALPQCVVHHEPPEASAHQHIEAPEQSIFAVPEARADSRWQRRGGTVSELPRLTRECTDWNSEVTFSAREAQTVMYSEVAQERAATALSSPAVAPAQASEVAAPDQAHELASALQEDHCCVDLSESAEPGEAITLRLRLGIVMVKQEPQDEIEAPDGGVISLAAPSDDDAGPEITVRCRLGVETRVKLEAASEPRTDAPSEFPVACFDTAGHRGSTSDHAGSYSASWPLPATRPHGDIRNFFVPQPHAPATEEDEAELQRQRQAEELEAAQTASYDLDKAERKERAARDRELVRQGDLGPLMSLDPDLMEKIMAGEGMFEWLESEERRALLFRYLELRSLAIRWYRGPAEEYFTTQRRHLEELLEESTAAVAMTPFLEEEVEKVEAELFAMPEKGRYVPRLFAPSACASAAGGLEGCVELD